MAARIVAAAMSESSESAGHAAGSHAASSGSSSHASPAPSPGLSYASPGLHPRRGSLVQLGGALGIGASFIGLAILLCTCAGLNAALYLSILPLILGAACLVLTVVGGVVQKDLHLVEDTHVLTGLFLGLLGVVGGLLEMAAWLKWQVF